LLKYRKARRGVNEEGRQGKKLGAPTNWVTAIARRAGFEPLCPTRPVIPGVTAGKALSIRPGFQLQKQHETLGVRLKTGAW
jgi:hypothetical protein